MTGAYWGLGVGEVGTGTKMCGGWQESARRHRNEGPGGQNHQKGLQAAPLASVRCVEGRRAHADIWTGSVCLRLSGLLGLRHRPSAHRPGWAPGRVGFLDPGWGGVGGQAGPLSCELCARLRGQADPASAGLEGGYLGLFVMGSGPGDTQGCW